MGQQKVWSKLLRLSLGNDIAVSPLRFLHYHVHGLEKGAKEAAIVSNADTNILNGIYVIAFGGKW